MREIAYYEDSYAGNLYETFEEFWAAAEEYLTPDAPSAMFNWPVWLEEYEPGTLSLGVFMQRHGVTAIWTAPATTEQVKQARDMMSDVWIGRIDSGCRRHAF